MRSAHAVFVLLACAVVASGQDVVILRNGNEFEGQIVEDREDVMVVRVEEPVGKVSLDYADLYSVNGISADRILGVRAEIQQFLARSRRRRGLTPIGSFSKQFLNPRDMTAILGDLWTNRFGKNEHDPEQAVLEKLHLIPSYLSLHEMLRDTYSDAHPAYFDPRSRILYLSVAPSARPTPEDRSEKATTQALGSSPTERLLIYHELQHLLQVHNYLGDTELLDLAPHGDLRLVLHALQEGDADLAMLDFLAETEQVEATTLPDLTAGLRLVPHATTARRQSLPPFVADVTTVPHEAGLAFVRSVHQAGGWALVGKVFQDLPSSTEQILHPEKYLVEREEPLMFDDPNLAEVLKGSAQIYSDVWGEMRTWLLLRRWLDSDDEARAAAAGWNGDRLFALRRDTGQVVLAWRSAWDTAEDAREFFEACRAMAHKRFGSRIRALPDATATLAAADVVTEDGLWQERNVIELRDREVLLLETSHLPSADAVREAVWSSGSGRAATEARVRAGAGEGRPPQVRDDARSFWRGGSLATAPAGLAFAEGIATAAGRLRFTGTMAWGARPDGALACASPAGTAVITVRTFTLPFPASSTLVGVWNENRGPSTDSPGAARRVVRTYPGWTLPAGRVTAYVAAESATDPELAVLARIYRAYLVDGTAGVLLELRFPEDQMQTFAAEADGILRTLALE